MQIILSNPLTNELFSPYNQVKTTVPAHNNHYEMKNLNMREVYEAWITASTKIGSGSSTSVVKLTPSPRVRAQIVNFGRIIEIPWKSDISLPCSAIGDRPTKIEWLMVEEKQKLNNFEINEEKSVIIKNIQRYQANNYTCVAKNHLGIDKITYQVQVLTPPHQPRLNGSSTSFDSVALNWVLADTGGSPIKLFIVNYRRQFGEWAESISVDRRSSSITVDGLECGTTYEFTVSGVNKIGTGDGSNIETIKTYGHKPIAPIEGRKIIKVNYTSAVLELSQFQVSIHFISLSCYSSFMFFFEEWRMSNFSLLR